MQRSALCLLLCLTLAREAAGWHGSSGQQRRWQARSLLDESNQEPRLASLRQRNEGEVETLYIRRGANGTLPCLPVPAADSQATMNKIEWYKDEKKLVEAEAKHIVVWNTKNTIAYLPETGALLFRGVTNEDSGEYHCLLSRPQTGDIEDGQVRLNVQDVPDPPQMPIVTWISQRSVNISWVPSFDYHYSPILHYVIHVREGIDGQWDLNNGVMTPDNRTQFEIIGLKPFTTYSFRVLAVNAIGPSQPSPTSHYIVTMRQKPDSRLNIISARNMSSSSIRIEWLPPSTDEIHGEFLGYRIRYVAQPREHQLPLANQSHGSHHKQQQLQQPGYEAAREHLLGDPSQTSFVIKGLSTFTPYKISVQVYNLAGDGPAAEVLATTDEGAPGPPANLSIVSVGDTWVRLRWPEPRSPNGILQGYQIHLHDIGNNSNEFRRRQEVLPIMEYRLDQLEPLTWYKVHVQAYTDKFVGEPSPEVKFRTDLSAPSAPLNVNVTCLSKDSLLIQWQRPEHFHNQIDYYYVQYKPDSSAWQTTEETTMAAKREARNNELLINNLTANQLYELKVLAGTRSVLDLSQVHKGQPSPTLKVVLQENCESV